jgi:hypothetical protein
MRIILLSAFVFLSLLGFSQSVETQLFVKDISATGGKVGIRIRSTAGTVPYIGATFYILYQSANASPGTIDDSKLVNTFGWGTSTRFINPNQSFTIEAGGQTYDRRYVYGNVDERTVPIIINLTTAWDTLVCIPFSFLQGAFPQGGFAYLQETAEAGGAALTDENFSNISFDVTTGSVALGASGSTLPVQFTSFTAQCSDKATNLTWTTASEKDNAYFDVQKSTDGSTWTSIGRVNGAGSSNSTKTYQFTDHSGGTAQYRIKQVDMNGAVAYSSIVRTSCSSSSFYVKLYPIPARDKLTLVVNLDKAVKSNVYVVDNNGRVVMSLPLTMNKGVNNFTLDVSHLSQGQYYLQSTAEEVKINHRFTITR